MKKIDRYIVKNFIKSILLSLFGFIAIFILSQLFKVIRYITEGGMSELDAVYYIIALLPDIIIKVMPLAVLLGGIMTINKMASSLEITALKTSGISFRRIVAYPIMISFFISLGIYYTYDKVFPMAIKKSREIKRGGYEEKKLPENKENAFLKGNGSYLYYAGNIDRVASKTENMEILELDETSGKIVKIITAKSGVYDRENDIWKLQKVFINNIEEKTSTSLPVFQDSRYSEEPEKFLVPTIDPKELNIKEMRDILAAIKQTGGNSVEILRQVGKRTAFPFASFVVSFLGLSLGSRYVRGASALGVALSVGLGYGYYIVQASMEAVSNSGLVHPFVGAWVPNVLFLALGIYAIRRAEY